MSEQINKPRHHTDVVDPARARVLQAIIGLEPTIQSGDPLPPFFHQTYFWDVRPLGALGDFSPDQNLPYTSWSAGKFVFHKPLIAGTRAERISTVESVTPQNGPDGQRVTVKIRHEIKQRHSLALTEWQEHIFREKPQHAGSAFRTAPNGETASHSAQYSNATLFQYAAVTFNANPIHHDTSYARDVAGYQDLVVPESLIALHLAQLAYAQRGALRGFAYRANGTLLSAQTISFCGKDRNYWAKGPDNQLIMLAEAS